MRLAGFIDGQLSEFLFSINRFNMLTQWNTDAGFQLVPVRNIFHQLILRYAHAFPFGFNFGVFRIDFQIVNIPHVDANNGFTVRQLRDNGHIGLIIDTNNGGTSTITHGEADGSCNRGFFVTMNAFHSHQALTFDAGNLVFKAALHHHCHTIHDDIGGAGQQITGIRYNKAPLSCGERRLGTELRQYSEDMQLVGQYAIPQHIHAVRVITVGGHNHPFGKTAAVLKVAVVFQRLVFRNKFRFDD